MDLLFYFDSERVYTDRDGNYYASGNFPRDVWNRYLKYCDNLYVIMREGNGIHDKDDPQNRKEKIDDPRIKVFLVKDIYGSIKDFFDIHKHLENRKIVCSVIHKCDYVIMRGVNSNVIKIIKKQGKPYLVESIGCPWDALWNHGWKGKVLAVPEFISARAAIKNAEWVLYVTNEFLQSRYPTKGKSIGVSDVSIADMDSQILVKRIQKITNIGKTIVLGTAGAVNVAYKGQEYVIRAIGKLKCQGYIVNYEMVGSGESGYLKKIAKESGVLDQVKFVGELTHDEVFRWMDSIDVYIQPSLVEGLPRALVEAMSRGLPAMGSRVGGIPELLDEEMLFKPKSIGDIAGHIQMLNQDILMQSAKKSFEKAKKFHKNFLDNKRDMFYKEFTLWAMARTNDKRILMKGKRHDL